MSESDTQTLVRVSWLQSLVSHRIVPVSFAKHLYRRCCSILSIPYDESAYRSMFDDAAKHLSVLDLEMRTYRDQQSGQNLLALVNTKADKQIERATRYSTNEIAYVKKLIEEIFTAKREAYAIPALEAVRLGGKLRIHLTRDATEELLKNLVDHRWIDYSTDGIYTLSTRSLLELRNYLQNEFGEDHYHTCTHCKDLVTLGIGCSYARSGCTTRYHYHCARNTIASAVDNDDALHRLAGFSCPSCSRTWKSRPIGPRALNLSAGGGSGGGDDGLFSSQGEASQEVARSSRQRRASEVNVEEDDEEEEEETAVQQLAEPGEDDQGEEPTQRRATRVKPEPQLQQTPTQRRSSRRPAPADDDDDDDFDEELEDVKPRKRAR